jgi:CRISPR-associated protein (TIGR03985 family)
LSFSRLADLFNLVKRQITSFDEQKKIRDILKHKSPDDVYYQAWIRLGDINLIMRLRDWRPNGEVIAPISIRESLKQEALQELSNYQV